MKMNTWLVPVHLEWLVGFCSTYSAAFNGPCDVLYSQVVFAGRIKKVELIIPEYVHTVYIHAYCTCTVDFAQDQHDEKWLQHLQTEEEVW